MIQIKSIQRKVLYECSCNTYKEALEKAVRDNVDLSFAELSGLNLAGADLKGANLENADLSCTNCKATIFHGANLKNAFFEDVIAHYSNFINANLRKAYLGCTIFRNSTFNYADLTGAYFEHSNLRGATFNCTNLCDVSFKSTDLINANLTDAINIPYIPLACPSEGSFIGWKICRNYLIKLEIPEDARRSSATSNKCRCDKAKVLAITDFEEKTSFSRVINRSYTECVYEVGKMVYPDSFDEDRWNECSHGIHFFINKQDAINYWL
jgi:hypothetical protein